MRWKKISNKTISKMHNKFKNTISAITINSRKSIRIVLECSVYDKQIYADILHSMIKFALIWKRSTFNNLKKFRSIFLFFNKKNSLKLFSEAVYAFDFYTRHLLSWNLVQTKNYFTYWKNIFRNYHLPQTQLTFEKKTYFPKSYCYNL